MKNNNNHYGFIDSIVSIIILAFIIGVFWIICSIRFSTNEQLVSGIVYDNTNNSFFSGNTYFKVRASVDTYINKDNESSYCLPPNSKYIPIVKKAAADKSIKVIVTTTKAFKIVGNPLVCLDNVNVEIQK